MTAAAPTRDPAIAPLGGSDRRRLRRRHALMLLLAAEVLAFGFYRSDRYRPPGVTVDQTFTRGHIIT